MLFYAGGNLRQRAAGRSEAMGYRWEMTPYQKNIWNLRVAMPGTAVCNNGGFIYSEIMTDYTLWQDTMRAVIRACSTLRIRMDSRGKLGLAEYTGYSLPYYDRRGKNRRGIEAEMGEWMRSPIPDVLSPLHDCRFIRTDKGMYMFGRFSHMIMDGAGFCLFMKRLEEIYLSFRENGETGLQEDDGFWQEIISGSEQERAEKAREKYQKKHAAAAGKQPDLRKFVSPAFSGRKEASFVRMKVPGSLDYQIRAYSKEHRISCEALLFCAAAAEVCACGGKDRTLLGRSVLNRTHRQLEQLGMYTNTQAIPVEQGDRTVPELLKDISAELMAGLRTAGYSFSEWKQNEGLDGNLFDLVISYRNRRFLPRMEHAQIGELFDGYLEVPLRLNWNEDETETEAELLYSVDGWREEEAELFLERLFHILEQMTGTQTASQPDGAEGVLHIRDIDMWCSRDRKIRAQMRGEPWKYTVSVPERFLRSMRERLDETVIRDEEGTLTGRELLRGYASAVSYMERKISENGQDPGNPERPLLVGLAVPRGRHYPVLMMAAMTAGAGFLPVDERAGETWQKELEQYCCIVIKGEDLEEVLSFEEKSPEELESLIQQIRGGSIAYGIPTSGTTGKPKIALNTQEGLACRLEWMTALSGEGGRYLQKTAKTFDVSVWEMLLPLTDGGTEYVVPEEKKADVEYLAGKMKSERITKVHFVPSILQSFLRYIETERIGFPDLKYLFSSGEELTAGTAQKAAKLFPGAQIWNLYGPAECSVDVSAYRYRSSKQAAKSVPIGRASPGTGLYVLDAGGREALPGCTGEICIAGKQTGAGYLPGSATAKEQERFFFLNGESAYRTGDRGRYGADGFLYYLGRMNAEVKLRGMRIDLSGIEKLTDSIPGVLGSAVCSDGKQLVVFYTSEGGVPEEKIRRILAEDMPAGCVPDRVIRLLEFPVGKNGKTDRKALERMLTKAEETPEKPEAKTAPGEKRQTDIRRFMELLAPYLDGRTPSADESVFEAGLTSLGAAELSMDLREAGYDVSYQDLYRGQTPSGILNISAQRDQGAGVIILGRERDPEDIFLCFPYAGGGAECFERFAAGFRDLTAQVWVVDPAWSAGGSGADRQKRIRSLVRRIPAGAGVHVMGYCAGASGAFEFLDALETSGKKADTMWLCAAYPYRSIGWRGREHTVWDILPKSLGKKFLEMIYGGEIPFDKRKYEAFRDEIRGAQKFMKYYRGKHRIRTFLIYGERDPLTAGYRRNYRLYHRYLKNRFTIFSIPEAGHYFMQNYGEKIAVLAGERIRRSGKRNETGDGAAPGTRSKKQRQRRNDRC